MGIIERYGELVMREISDKIAEFVTLCFILGIEKIHNIEHLSYEDFCGIVDQLRACSLGYCDFFDKPDAYIGIKVLSSYGIDEFGPVDEITDIRINDKPIEEFE